MSNTLIRQCAWCKRVWDAGKQEWIEHHETIAIATHSLCESCYEVRVKEDNLATA